MKPMFLQELLDDKTLSYAERAEGCLAWLASDSTPRIDLARPDYQAAAHTFALLAVAEKLGEIAS